MYNTLEVLRNKRENFRVEIRRKATEKIFKENR